MRYRLNNVKACLECSEKDVELKVIEKFGGVLLRNLRIVKKSLDARKKSELFYIYAVEFEADEELLEDKDLVKVVESEEIDFSKFVWELEDRPVVVGSGPSGMMSGICLAEMGAKPIILERGDEVEERKAKVNKFWKKGLLDEVSNVQFGEGGAGTFSDGN